VTPIQTAVLQVVLSLLVAVATALLTVWLSLRRFYREKWWEAKMRAYTEVIQALHHMKRDLHISIAAEEEGRHEAPSPASPPCRCASRGSTPTTRRDSAITTSGTMTQRSAGTCKAIPLDWREAQVAIPTP
jgi:hypothetical protein